MEFIQSGDHIQTEIEVRKRDPYAIHLMKQPMLMDFIPRYDAVEEWHITNFLAAQKNWLEEEKELRKEWRK